MLPDVIARSARHVMLWIGLAFLCGCVSSEPDQVSWSAATGSHATHQKFQTLLNNNDQAAAASLLLDGVDEVLRKSRTGLVLDRTGVPDIDHASLVETVAQRLAALGQLQIRSNDWSYRLSIEWTPGQAQASNGYTSASCSSWLPTEPGFKPLGSGSESTVIAGSPLLMCAQSGSIGGREIDRAVALHPIRGGLLLLRYDLSAVGWGRTDFPDALYILFERIDQAIHPGWSGP